MDRGFTAPAKVKRWRGCWRHAGAELEPHALPREPDFEEADGVPSICFKSVFENVALPLEVTGTPRNEIARRVGEVIEQVGLEGRHERRPGELSGGEQQRVAIARAVVGKPSIVVADEPTGNLDAELTHEIFELLVKLHRQDGTTVLVATHDTVELDRWDFRRVGLTGGRLDEVADDSAAEASS